MRGAPPDVLSSVEIYDLRAFLTRAGWHQFKPTSARRVETWVKEVGRRGAMPALKLPVDRELADYIPLLAQALQDIAVQEELSDDDLLVEISHPQATLINLGVDIESRYDGGIPLVLGAAMADALIETSWSVLQRVAGEPMGQSVDQLLQQTRLEHTQPGSFVMRAVLPAPVNKPVQLLHRLLEASLEHLTTAYGEAREPNVHPFGRTDPGSTIWWMTRALGRLAHNDVLSAFVTIANTASTTKERAKHRFSFERPALFDMAAVVPTLDLSRQIYLEEPRKVAALREIPEPRRTVHEERRLEGSIFRLERPTATLDTWIDEHRRRVRLAGLTDEQHSLALRAYSEGRTVLVHGMLAGRPRAFVMAPVYGITIL